ncbi:MAG: hypothetical protein N3G78_09575 [Desulfobacterota bacterium]|nr:hypothetical protein [Thermodesulfobacteriota bacterium]
MSRPVIKKAFAIDRGPYGMIWRAYLEAEDPDGDMERIAVRVDQVGFGSYPTSWIVLKPEYRWHFLGYLQWNTFSSSGSSLREWTRLTVKVSIFDRAGNESDEQTFPVTFLSGEEEGDGSLLPNPFHVEDLPCIGFIHVDLTDPSLGF